MTHAHRARLCYVFLNAVPARKQSQRRQGAFSKTWWATFNAEEETQWLCVSLLCCNHLLVHIWICKTVYLCALAAVSSSFLSLSSSPGSPSSPLILVAMDQPLLGRASARCCCSYSTLKAWLPILSWLPRYELKWLQMDLLAGVTVGLTTVPQALAYAEVAGLPVQVNLNQLTTDVSVVKIILFQYSLLLLCFCFHWKIIIFMYSLLLLQLKQLLIDRILTGNCFGSRSIVIFKQKCHWFSLMWGFSAFLCLISLQIQYLLVLNCWLDKTRHLKMSLCILGNKEGPHLTSEKIIKIKDPF